MTLEILVQNAEPTDGTSGTTLNNSIVINIDPPTFTSGWKNDTSVTGLPLKRWEGNSAPKLQFEVVILETGTTSLTTSSLGLVDLDVLRKAESGYDGSNKGLMVWIRDTEGDYLIRHWKGGYMSNLDIKRIQGYQNKIGSTLYKVTFDFEVVFYGGDAHHQLIRW